MSDVEASAEELRTAPATPGDVAAIGSPIERAFLFDRPDHGLLVLVRHGQQDHVSARGAAEHHDPPLTELGRRQADAAARLLSEAPVAAVYASPLQRARATGEAVAARHGLPVTIVEDLAEVRVFEQVPSGKRVTDLVDAETLRRAGDAFVRERRWGAFPLSEPSETFRRRVATAVDAIVGAHPGECVVVACHGGVINAVVCELFGVEADFVFRPAHASVQRVAFADGRRIIRSLNEVHHLPGELLTH